MPATHLVSVWNPSYASDAMDAHLDLLLEWSRKQVEDKAKPDDVYVWWAKVRSQNRRQAIPHAADITALQKQIEDEVETHLYLTDYRSLYVAHVDEITTDNVLEDDEADHAPAYYTERGYAADFWFRLLDIRRLVADDTVAVGAELATLLNLRYHERPVSMYGGFYELPLLVRSKGEERHRFADRALYIDEPLWAARDDVLRRETERIGADLRDNLIGRALWPRLEIATRNFLASGEAIFRQHREDSHFDFAPAAVEYAKAIEVEVNRILRPGLAEIKEDRHQSLGWLARTLEKPPQALSSWLARKMAARKGWLTGELPARLTAIAEFRNPGAHGEILKREQASLIREETLGIGQDGLIVKLARLSL